jgi:hypothetical protein
MLASRIFRMFLFSACVVACQETDPADGAGSASTTGSGGAAGSASTGGQGGGCPHFTCESGESPFDKDKDGCPETCCVACPADFVPTDGDMDGCANSCVDKPCTLDDGCSVYACTFEAGDCDTPHGICSDVACNAFGPVCGCDGKTYDTGCDANKAGVPEKSDGPCP